MNSDGFRDIQLLFQLLHNGHGPVLGLDDGNPAELSARAGDKPPRQIAWVDLEPAHIETIASAPDAS